jgi:hypothetical protein
MRHERRANPVPSGPADGASPTSITSKAGVAELAETIGDWQPPSNERWCDLSDDMVPSTRIAWMTIRKTRQEVDEMVRSLGNDGPGALAELMYQRV